MLNAKRIRVKNENKITEKITLIRIKAFKREKYV